MLRILTIALALWIGGCTIVHQELDNRGGYVDYLADKYWWKADSKKMRALRAYALHTAIARIAMISPKGAAERNQLAYQIGNAGIYAQQLVACAYDTVGEPCFYFDSIMVDYVGALYSAAIAALPLEDAKKLINDITGGIAGPAAAVDALHALIQLGVDAVRYGTVSAALYRDSLELEVQVWINSPSEPGSQVTLQDVAPLAAIYATGRDDIPAWKAEIERLLNAGLEPTPNRRYLARLFKLMSYACMQITPDPTFRQKCIVDPGAMPPTRTMAIRQSSQTGAQDGTTTSRNTTVTATQPGQTGQSETVQTTPRQSGLTTQAAPQGQTQPDQKRAQLLDLAKTVAKNEQLIGDLQKKANGLVEGPVKTGITARIANLRAENDQKKAQAEALKQEIDDTKK